MIPAKDNKSILLIVLPYLPQGATNKNSKLRSFKTFPYGVLSIATYLKKFANDKINVEVLDCNISSTNNYLDAIKQKVSDFNPDIVGLSMMFDNSNQYLRNITNVIKEFKRKIFIVLGGSSASSSYKVILEEQENIDGICFSEGELPLLRLINSKNIAECLETDVSWITRKSLKEGKVPQASLIKNLDDVVSIEYNFIEIQHYGMEEAFSPYAGTRQDRKQFFLVTSRGCPFKCIFCMRSSDNDRSVRYASVEKVIEHVEILVSEYGMNVLTIYDDQLLFNKVRAKKLFKELAKFNLRVECPNGLSVAYIDEEMARLMKAAGVDTVYLAIESGSPYVLNKIIHKPLTVAKVKPIVKILRDNDFWIQGYFVSGIPGEKDEHREETVNFIKDAGIDWSGFSLAIPSRGSELYRLCVENNYIEKEIAIGELDTTKFIIRTPEYTPEYVTRKTYLMNLDVNFVNNNRMKHGEYRIAADCFKDVIKRYPGHAFAYYYLAEALRKLNEDPAKVNHTMNKVYEIVSKDREWSEYFGYFNISLEKVQTETLIC